MSRSPTDFLTTITFVTPLLVGRGFCGLDYAFTLSYDLGSYRLVSTPSRKCMQFRKYSEDDLIKAISNNTSVAGVLKSLNVKPCGGNYTTVQTYIEKMSLDTSHFKGQAWSRGSKIGPKREISEYLNNSFPIGSHKLRLRLLKEGFFKHQCSCCKRRKWLQEPIPLELHHKDGDNKNNLLSNLELLCPNCHSQTENFRGKNKS